MALPGFTAEVSVGPATQQYRATNIHGHAAIGHLVPQAGEVDVDGAEAWDEEGEDEAGMETEGAGDENGAAEA